MNIQIKSANIDDLNDIQRLNNELFELEYKNFDPDLALGWPYTDEGKEYFIDMINNNKVYIAQIDSKTVGYLAGTLHTNTSYITKCSAELDNMYIDSQYRGVGIGKLLVDRFKKECKLNNIEVITVTATAKNTNAIEFYKKSGFNDYNLTLKLEV